MRFAFELLVTVLGWYLSIGLVAAGYLVLAGLSKIDHAVTTGTLWFRVIVFPGLVALWPVMLIKSLVAEKGTP